MVSMLSDLGSAADMPGRGARSDGFGPSAHACWGYASHQERVSVGCEWLRDGLQRGQRGVYVADQKRDSLMDELRGLPDSDRKLARGELLVFSTTDIYDMSVPIDAEAQLAFYADAVEQALADGFHGLRVVADITSLVADPGRRPAHVHWEQVADRYIAAHPLAPLCLYDSQRISNPDAIAGCHPLQGPRPSRFAFFAAQPDRGALAGEIDIAGERILADLLSAQPASDRVVDVSSLHFIDGQSAWLLHKHLLDRRASDNPLVLTGASPMMQRIWSNCGFESAFLN